MGRMSRPPAPRSRASSASRQPGLDFRALGVEMTNPDKVLYPGGGFTKGQVVAYYAAVAPFILPHLEDRPVSLKRYPDGVAQRSFWEKDAPRYTPDWVKTFPVPRRRGAHRLHPDQRPPHARVDGQSRRPRAPPVPPPGSRDREADGHRVRPGPRRRCGRPDVRAGRTPAEGTARPAASGVLPQGLGLEGPPALRPPESPGHVRRDPTVRAGHRRSAGARASDARRRRDGEARPGAKGLHRLEPERRAQDDGRRLLAPGQARPALRLAAGDLAGARCRTGAGRRERIVLRAGG